jgi:hypothetical protein
MKTYILATLAVAIWTAIVEAKLEIVKVEAAHGQLGPERKTSDVYPLDEIVFRYQVTGAKTDASGKTDAEAVLRLVNPNGKQVLEKKTPLQHELTLGGGTFPAFAVLDVPPAEKAPAGEYTVTVQVRDKIASESASFERKFTIKPTSLQVVAPRFSRDAEGKTPAPAGGVVGETIHFKLRLIGFDKSKKKVQAALSVRILDENGKEVQEKPKVIRVEQNVPEEAARASQVNFNGVIYLNRSGNFTIKFEAKDVVGDATATFEIPWKVMAP